MNIRQNLVSPDMYGIKCPHEMTPTCIVVHNTANDASAENEIAYMRRNSNKVSFHYAVDDKEIVQGILENRNAWHAGDGGNGKGNRYGIAIEICYSKSGGERFTAAEKLAAKFIASKLKEKGWGIDRVTKHQDYMNKYCPHRTLDMGWQRYIDMITTELQALDGNTNEPAPAPTPASNYKIGDHVVFSTCYTSSDAPIEKNIPAAKMARNHGVITRIVDGAKNPYLLDGDMCWVNDGDIRGYYNGTRTGTVATKSKNLNVRASASIEGKILGSLAKGTPVEILGESSGWYEVRANGLTGWCSGEYIR